jgi:methionyl-tRNA formyltransferase
MIPSMAQPLKVLLIAQEAIGARAVALVAAAGHRIVYAITSDDPGAPTAKAARAGNIPVLPPGALDDPGLAAHLRERAIDLLVNVHSLVIVRPDILRTPRIGGFNLHPGPLPRYAGLNVPSWAIYNGETRFGCTLHWMNAGLDAGPIAYAATFSISADDTGLSLSARSAREGLLLLERLLAAASDPSTIPRVPQDLAARTFFRGSPPNGGSIDWGGSATQVERFVRACDYGPFDSPWAPAPRTWNAAGTEIRVLRATAVEAAQPELPPGSVVAGKGDAAVVAAVDGWVTVERVYVAGRVQPPSGVLRPGTRLLQNA